MRKYIVHFIIVVVPFFIFSIAAEAQTLNSYDGFKISPIDTLRALNVFINIHYDQTPEADPMQGKNGGWIAGSPNSINSVEIPFFKNFMDAQLSDSNFYNGSMTRLFAESSFGKFIILGDYVLVDLLQSDITPEHPGAKFTWSMAVVAAFRLIERQNGLQTMYQHNSISDYDANSDGDVDFLQVMFRNTTSAYGTYGSKQGHSGKMSSQTKIMIEGSLCGIDYHSVQFTGKKDFSKNPISIVKHEFAHNLIGGNALHSTGGHHYYAGVGTFVGLQGGFGLLGNYNSSLVSCNAFDRWWLGWASDEFNPEGIAICASGKASDITQESGACNFVLRDFVTTGDAVRIRLPYVGKVGLPQFLWLENHQVGRNNKLDFLQYSNTHDCRPQGNAGVYAYIQLGHEKRTGRRLKLYSTEKADFIKVLPADGNWDWEATSDSSVSCVKWSKKEFCNRQIAANPLMGLSDMSMHFKQTDDDEIKSTDGHYMFLKETIEGEYFTNLPALGDNFDAFEPGDEISIGTNPSSANVCTFYNSRRGRSRLHAYDGIKNESQVYLSGLRVGFEEQQEGEILVKITWDNYRIENDVRWTGDIVVREKIILGKGKHILLDQNFSPSQVTRDSITREFSKNTIMHCRKGSELILEEGASIHLTNKSALTIAEGAVLIMGEKAEIIVDKGCSFFVDEKAVFEKSRKSRVKRK